MMRARGWAAPAAASVLLFALSVAFTTGIDLARASLPGKSGPVAAGTLLMEISRRPPLALGFRTFLADLVWLQAVQVAGARNMPPEEYDRLFRLVNTVANYDARFDIPYILGGLVLGESPAHAREAVMVLSRGREHHPDDWRFPFYIGFTHYFSLGNPTSGGAAMAEAAQLPGSPAYLPRLAARMMVEGRDPGTALAFLAAAEAHETDEARKEILRRRIREVVVERDIQLLERAVASYREKVGRSPATLDDLAREEFLVGIPREPHGGAYVLLPDGTVRSDMVSRRLKVFVR